MILWSTNLGLYSGQKVTESKGGVAFRCRRAENPLMTFRLNRTKKSSIMHQAHFLRQLFVVENSHGHRHTLETELPVEGFVSRRGV